MNEFQSYFVFSPVLRSESITQGRVTSGLLALTGNKAAAQGEAKAKITNGTIKQNKQNNSKLRLQHDPSCYLKGFCNL